jgi:hypothetical protein
MPLLYPKSATEASSPSLAEALDAPVSDPASVPPATNHKMQPQEICLLREFFLLLDEWDAVSREVIEARPQMIEGSPGHLRGD